MHSHFIESRPHLIEGVTNGREEEDRKKEGC